MWRLEPQTRFLFRGSACLIGLLVLWWLVLLSPMLYVLKSTAGSFLPIEDHPSGEWTVRVPVELTLPATPREPVAKQIRSIDFDLARNDAIGFTFSLPVYWAIMLGAPKVRNNLRPLLLGTLLMLAAEVAMLLAFAQITGLDGVAQLAGVENPVGRWIRRVGVYLLVSVLPYITPFVLALWLHRDLRSEVFGLVKPANRDLMQGRRRERRPSS